MPEVKVNADGSVTRNYKHINFRVEKDKGKDRKVMYYDDKKIHSGWVRVVMKFDGEKPEDGKPAIVFEDGYRQYQHGQVVEIRDQLRLADYLDDGWVVPCEAPPPPPTNPWKGQPFAKFRCVMPFATSHSQFEIGEDYNLPEGMGKKYVDRGFMVEVKEQAKEEGRRTRANA